jgi:hypothetical protein
MTFFEYSLNCLGISGNAKAIQGIPFLPHRDGGQGVELPVRACKCVATNICSIQARLGKVSLAWITLKLLAFDAMLFPRIQI